MGFGIPTFQLFCLLVDVHRILPTYALALSARQVYARTNPYQHYALGETGTRDLGLYLVGTTFTYSSGDADIDTYLIVGTSVYQHAR